MEVVVLMGWPSLGGQAQPCLFHRGPTGVLIQGGPLRQASSRFSQCMNQILNQLGLGICDAKRVTCVLAESPIRLGAPREDFVPAPPQNDGLSWGSQACKPA